MIQPKTVAVAARITLSSAVDRKAKEVSPYSARLPCHRMGIKPRKPMRSPSPWVFLWRKRMERREGYWDYMGRMLREDSEKEPLTMDNIWKKEVAEMQKNINYLQIRVKTLNEQVHELNNKVHVLGGDPRQLELKL